MAKKKVKPKARSLEKLVQMKEAANAAYEEFQEALATAVEKYGEGDFWYSIDETDEGHKYQKVTLIDNNAAKKRGEKVGSYVEFKDHSSKFQKVKTTPKDLKKICS